MRGEKGQDRKGAREMPIESPFLFVESISLYHCTPLYSSACLFHQRTHEMASPDGVSTSGNSLGGQQGSCVPEGCVHTFPQAGPLTPHSPFFQLEL